VKEVNRTSMLPPAPWCWWNPRTPPPKLADKLSDNAHYPIRMHPQSSTPHQRRRPGPLASLPGTSNELKVLHSPTSTGSCPTLWSSGGAHPKVPNLPSIPARLQNESSVRSSGFKQAKKVCDGRAAC